MTSGSGEAELEAARARLRAAPRDPDAYLAAARAFARAGRAPEAAAALDRALVAGNDAPGDAVRDAYLRAQRDLDRALGDPRAQWDQPWVDLRASPCGRWLLVLGAVYADGLRGSREYGLRVLRTEDLGLACTVSEWRPGDHFRVLDGGDVLRRWRLPGAGPRPGSRLERVDFSLPSGRSEAPVVRDLPWPAELVGVGADGAWVLLAREGELLTLAPSGEVRLIPLPAPEAGSMRRLERAAVSHDGRWALVHGFDLAGGAPPRDLPPLALRGRADASAWLALVDLVAEEVVHHEPVDDVQQLGPERLPSQAAWHDPGSFSPDGTRVAWLDRTQAELVLHVRELVRPGEGKGLPTGVSLGVPRPDYVVGSSWPRHGCLAWLDEGTVALAHGDELRCFRAGSSPVPAGAPTGGLGWATGVAPCAGGAAVATPWGGELVGVDSGLRVPRLGHRWPIESLRQGLDRDWVATLDVRGELRVWDVESGACVGADRVEDRVRPVDYHRETRFDLSCATERVLVAGPEGAIVLAARGLDVVAALEPSPGARWRWAALAPGGHEVLVGLWGGGLQRLDLAGRVQAEYPQDEESQAGGFVAAGRAVAACGANFVAIHDLVGGPPRATWNLEPEDPGVSTWVQDLPGGTAFLAQGSWLDPVACPFDGGSESWYLRHGRLLQSAHALAFSPAGDLVAVVPATQRHTAAGRLQLWDAAAMRPLRVVAEPRAGKAGLAFSPCGSRLLVARACHVEILGLEGDAWVEFPQE